MHVGCSLFSRLTKFINWRFFCKYIIYCRICNKKIMNLSPKIHKKTITNYIITSASIWASVVHSAEISNVFLTGTPNCIPSRGILSEKYILAHTQSIIILNVSIYSRFMRESRRTVCSASGNGNWLRPREPGS